jgi:geranylgeranyl pyrophosphate synthase
MEEPDKVRDRLREEVPFGEIESVLQSKLERDEDREILDDILDYDARILTDGGKRVRVALPYLMAEGLETDLDDSEIIEALIPLEIFHGASLLIDDVVDGDGKRRDMVTPHEKFQDHGYSSKQSESVAVLDATELQSIAVTISYEMDFLSSEKRLQISKVVQESVSDVARSQILDISAENFFEEDFREGLQKSDKLDFEDFYIDLIDGKTVSLFKAGPKIIEAITEENLEGLRGYMDQLGKAYQIRDDVLDITGGREDIDLENNDSNEIGKDRYSDLREGSMTLPVFYALEMIENRHVKDVIDSNSLPDDHRNSESKEFLEQVIENECPNNSELNMAAKIIADCGALDKADQKAETHAERAVKRLERSGLEDEYKEILERMAYYAAKRVC